MQIRALVSTAADSSPSNARSISLAKGLLCVIISVYAYREPFNQWTGEESPHFQGKKYKRLFCFLPIFPKTMHTLTLIQRAGEKKYIRRIGREKICHTRAYISAVLLLRTRLNIFFSSPSTFT